MKAYFLAEMKMERKTNFSGRRIYILYGGFINFEMRVFPLLCDAVRCWEDN